MKFLRKWWLIILLGIIALFLNKKVSFLRNERPGGLPNDSTFSE